MAAAAYDEDLSAYDEYVLLYGEPPYIDDFATRDEYHAAFDSWQAGLSAYTTQRAMYFDSIGAEQEAAWIAAEQEKAKSPPAAEEPAPKAAPTKPTESAGASHAVSSNHVNPSVDTSVNDKYPVGSWVDPAGNVYSSSGELLSPGTTPAMAPAPDPAEKAPVSSVVVADSDIPPVSPNAETDPLTDDLPQPVWYVEDLRPAAAPVDVLTGLKSMVTSIFGEYTPVTTTSVISETVGNETRQYLVATVAPGAAGVDYEWIAGVVLFGIMLFCLMKLLGGVIK